LSLEERYKTHAGYVDAVTRAAKDLAAQRLLLEEDVQKYILAAERSTAF
jgi:HJR/Mrr/RecB family endonuclease